MRELRRTPVENLSVWAKFKYDAAKPAHRVHMWEVFDTCSNETKSFEALFEAIYDALHAQYVDQGFQFGIGEVDPLVTSEQCLNSGRSPGQLSDDSAHERLAQDVGRITRYN